MLMVKIPCRHDRNTCSSVDAGVGMDNDRDIFAAIAGPVEAMKYTVANLNDVKDNEEYSVETEDEALAWLEKKFAAGQQKEYRETRINNLLDKELLPHLGQGMEHRNKKAIFLGGIVRQVLEMAINDEDPNDKDHYANKSETCRRPNRGLIQGKPPTTGKGPKYQLRGIITESGFSESMLV